MLNMKVALSVMLSVALSTAVDAEIVLSEHIMELSQVSAFLSSEAYNSKPNATGFDSLKNFVDEPDQAILAEKKGYCYLAFRGTTPTMSDWFQNFEVGKESVCCENDSKNCCDVREGFFNAFNEPNYLGDLEKAVHECVKKCKHPDDCLVITGHSQGGAVAAVAGVRYTQMNPYVITFGEPPSVNPECAAVTSERWYRYVNTVESVSGVFAIAYDPVPFCPGLGTIVYGHLIMLGKDVQDVAYIGLDSTDAFSPLNMLGANAHFMKGTPEMPGYLDRINDLVENAKSYPIAAKGWATPNFCTDSKECMSQKCESRTFLGTKRCIGNACKKDEDCDTKRCDLGECLPKLGSCMWCNEDADCASEKCVANHCANLEGKMDNECVCDEDKDCASGRCEGLWTSICEPQLAAGARCGEHSDCLSNKCTWLFRCAKSSDEQQASITM